MPNLRRSITSPHGLSPAAEPHRRSALWRWLLIVGIAALLLIVLAWIDGGEESLHPIAEPVALPEQQP